MFSAARMEGLLTFLSPRGSRAGRGLAPGGNWGSISECRVTSTPEMCPWRCLRSDNSSSTTTTNASITPQLLDSQLCQFDESFQITTDTNTDTISNSTLGSHSNAENAMMRSRTQDMSFRNRIRWNIAYKTKLNMSSLGRMPLHEVTILHFGHECHGSITDDGFCRTNEDGRPFTGLP